jgi:RNA polymerase primary sigma factor
VVSIARVYVGRGVPLPDLISEGNLGLLRAVEGYDPKRGIRFSTYASYWVKRSIRMALLDSARTVRVPAYAVRLLVRWRRAATELKAELHRNPTEEEVAGRLGVRRKSVCIERASQLRNAGPQGVQEGPGGSVELTLPDVALAEEEEVGRLMRLLGGLGERAALVIRLRFGLGGEARLTLEEIGALLGLTRERIHQIEKEALAKLAEKL